MNRKRGIGLVGIALILLLALGNSFVWAQTEISPLRVISKNSGSASGAAPLGDWLALSDMAPSTHQFEFDSAVSYNTCINIYLIVWRRSTNAGNVIFGQRLYRNGELLGIPFRISPSIGDNLNPDVVFEQQDCRWLVVYEVGSSGIYAQRVNGGGELNGTEFAIVGSPGSTYDNPALAYGNGMVVIAFHHLQSGNHSIEARPLVSQSTIPGTIVTLAAPSTAVANYPDVARDPSGDDFFVVWQKYYGDYQKNDIEGQMLDISGNELAKKYTILTLHNYPFDETHPSIGAIRDGAAYGVYLIAAEINLSSTLYVNGVIMDHTAITLAPVFPISLVNGRTPVVAGSRSTREFLVAWAESNSLGVSITAVKVEQFGGVGSITNVGGLNVMNQAIEAGIGGDFLITQDDLVSGLVNIYGRFMGQHIYLPVTFK